jgi:OOP family OmpA-OmpF porin
MRKLAIGVALATTALTPAMARDGAWYAGVEGGVMLVEDTDYDVNGVSNDLTVDSDYGWNADAVVGYDFGAFRIEAEVGYQRADADEVVTGTQGIAGNNLSAASTFDVAGDTSALSFMLNGLLDFGADDGIQGFVGGGAGVARVSQDLVLANNFVDDSDTSFAWQAIAGVRAPLTESVDVGLKYKFFNVPNVDLISSFGDTYEGRYRSHSLLGSLIFNFGAPEPVVAPPPPPAATPAPPPPPPPVPEPVSCNSGPYIVFFDWDKSNLRPDAATVLDNAVAQYANCGSARVMLAGYTDTSGTATYNVGLSQRRNASVQSYLQSRGVPQARIATEAFGETNLRVPTADGVREPQNRRVEITYGPNAGY